MAMFHLDKWNKNGKQLSTYLNENANEEEFNILDENIARLENIVIPKDKDVKALFNEFTRLGLDDSKFAEFLNAFVKGLRDKKVDGKLFDTADENGSTKDKAVIIAKLHILKTLMFEFLHIEETNTIVDEEIFIADVVGIEKSEVYKNIDTYREDLNGNNILQGLKDNCIRDGSKLLDKQNNLSLLAMVAYSYKIGQDLDKWLTDFASKNNTYITNQRQNYFYMRDDFNKYLEKGKVA